MVIAHRSETSDEGVLPTRRAMVARKSESLEVAVGAANLRGRRLPRGRRSAERAS